MRLVLDASVCIKWYLADDKKDLEPARELLERLTEGSLRLIQPPIWHAEISTVLARKLPAVAGDYARELCALEIQIQDSAGTLARAVQLSIDLNHHLFDTLYHAIAIERHIDLITADEHYYRKANKFGHITLLRDWKAPIEVREAAPSYSPRARKAPEGGRRKRR